MANRASPRARRLADRHYSRKTVGAPQFVPPGRCFVLVTECGRAYWVTSWPFGEFVQHAWPGAWICSAFRNEGAGLSSELIREAVAATRALWPEVPDLGMVTFVDPNEVKKVHPGYCFKLAGFKAATPRTTKGGLLAFQLLPEAMPVACPAVGFQGDLFDPVGLVG